MAPGKKTSGQLLALVHRSGPVSRAAATAELGLARSAIGTALAELTGLGLLRVTEPSAGGGRGRPSPVIEPDPSGPVGLAVQLTPDRIEVAAGGIGGGALSPRAVRWRPTDPVRAARRVATLVRRAVRESRRPCAGICVALPATMRDTDGFVFSALHLDWSGVEFGDLLAAELGGEVWLPGSAEAGARSGSGAGVPLRFGQDSKLAGLAEYHRGRGRGSDSLLLLTCDRLGIGGALVSAGELFGGTGYAVEAGHVTVEPRGRRCPCGLRGCLELYADTRAFLAAAGGDAGVVKATLPASGEVRVAFTTDGLLAGTTAAGRRAVTVTGDRLATGLAGLVNTLAPDRVVLTGFLAELFRADAERLRERLLRRSVVARAKHTDVLTGSLPHPVLTGAVDRALADLIADPTRV